MDRIRNLIVWHLEMMQSSEYLNSFKEEFQRYKNLRKFHDFLVRIKNASNT